MFNSALTVAEQSDGNSSVVGVGTFFVRDMELSCLRQFRHLVREHQFDALFLALDKTCLGSLHHERMEPAEIPDESHEYDRD